MSNTDSSAASDDWEQPVTRTKNQKFQQVYRSVKDLSLSHLTAKQHMFMAFCRDVSLLPPIAYTFISWKRSWQLYFSNIDRLTELQSLKDTLAAFWQISALYNMTTQPSTEYTPKVLAPVDQGPMILSSLMTPRASEHLLCSVWCIVSLYLTYAILDSLMVRWIVKYSTLAAILRMFSMSLVLVTVELLLLTSLSPDNNYFLHSWILISCILTVGYIWQSYLTSDLDYVNDADSLIANEIQESSDLFTSRSLDSNEELDSNLSRRLPRTSQPPLQPENEQLRTVIRKKEKKKHSKSFRLSNKRTINLYKIVVFCVVPVGMASFLTMLGLLRIIVIQRLDVEQLETVLKENYKPIVAQ